LVTIFIKKCQVGPQLFFSFNLIIFFRFIVADQRFSSRLTVGLC